MSDDDLILAGAVAIGGFLLANPALMAGLAFAGGAAVAVNQGSQTIEELINPGRRLSPVSQVLVTLFPGSWSQNWFDWSQWVTR